MTKGQGDGVWGRLGRAAGWAVVGMLLGAGCHSTPRLMPTPNVLLRDGGEAFGGVPPGLRSNVVDVLYVTDRRPAFTPGGSLTYGHGRSGSLAFGSAFVSLGDDVAWESLVEDSTRRRRAGRYPLRVREVWERGRFPETPYELGPGVGDRRVRADVLEAERVIAGRLRGELAARLASTPRKEVTVYVHGFNNGFGDAVTMAAQLWHFQEREGVWVAYTWPGGIGGVRGYAYDRESGEFTVHHLKQFLRVLLGMPEVERVNLVAHSRGTDVLTSALRELALERWGGVGRYSPIDRVANVVLLAPDIDVDVVLQRVAAEQLALAVERMTVYVCQEDRAITLSNWMFEGVRRLGIMGQGDLQAALRGGRVSLARVQFVEVDLQAGFLGHGYFYSDPAASSDLLMLLRCDCDPGADEGRPLERLAPGFWRLDKDYPRGGED